MANRTPRGTETREAAQRVTGWTSPNLLPDPYPREGVVYRWVRTSTLGNSDSPNVSTRFREGWEPVPEEDVPELKLVMDRNTRFPGNVEVGGLLLCRNSAENMDARKRHFDNVAANQLRAADNALLKENDPRMPIHAPQRSSSVTFGGSRNRS